MNTSQTAQLFKALSDENRLRVLSIIAKEEQCACVLLEQLEITQPTLSHHMKILEEADVVSTRREGKWAYYTLKVETIKAASDALTSLGDGAPGSSSSCCCGSKGEELTEEQQDLLTQVKERYVRAAKMVTGAQTASCCGPQKSGTASCCGSQGGGAVTAFAASDSLGASLYQHESSEEIKALPEDALLASLGCGNPTAVADLHEGETVLDLGSGGGIDVLLSAVRVGESGFAYGLDMTDEMLALARKNAAEAGAKNVEFLKGRIEEVPLPDKSIDVVISNCVINLSVDKPAVFKEMARVLKDGGRIGVSDVVATNGLTKEERAAKGDYTGCIAGALSFEEYEAGLSAAGFSNIEITTTHEVVDGMFASIIKAHKHAA